MNALKSRITAWRERGLITAGLAVGGAYLALAVAFMLLTPAWENSDETSHVEYIEYVADHGTLPRISLKNGVESHQAPLYYYLGAAWQRFRGIDPFTPDTPAPPAGLSLDHPGYVLSHEYTPRQHRQAVWIHELRLVSIGFGLAAVFAALATGWLLTERVLFAAALAVTVALWPKFLVVTSAITNTALVDALCACAVPCFLVWARTRGRRWAAITGLVLGAAALTQETALPVAGLMLLLLIAFAWRERDWQAPLLAVAGFVAVCGWWYVRNDVLYGDPLASQAAQAYLEPVGGWFGSLVRDPPSLSLDVIGSSLESLTHSIWYNAGRGQLRLPDTIDFAVLALAFVCILAAFLSQIPARLLLAACVVASLIGWLLIVRVTIRAEGRYLLVAIVPWAALLVAGGTRLMGNRKAALLLWPVIMLGLDVYVLAHWLIPNAAL